MASTVPDANVFQSNGICEMPLSGTTIKCSKGQGQDKSKVTPKEKTSQRSLSNQIDWATFKLEF